MDADLAVLLGAIAAGGAVYFTIEWIGALRDRNNLTYLERTAIEVEAQSERAARSSVLSRVRTAAQRAGWNGDITVPLVAVAVLYLLCAGALRLAGADPVVAVAVAVPASALAVRQTVRTLAARRRKVFNQQLVQALDLLAGQMEAGNGVQRSLEVLIPTIADPLRSEFEAALEATVASKDLVEALRDIEARYPSRAMKLFVSALDIEKYSAGQLGRPVREAASLLRGDFELNAEIKAETAQQKMAAIVMVVGIGAIAGLLIVGLDSAPYTTPVGVTVMSIATLNFVYGALRIARMLRRIEGEA